MQLSVSETADNISEFWTKNSSHTNVLQSKLSVGLICSGQQANVSQSQVSQVENSEIA